jgi:hypothetical protein
MFAEFLNGFALRDAILFYLTVRITKDAEMTKAAS